MALTIGPNAPRSSIDRARQAFEKAMEQLSSASRITRAGDDAAGLAISQQLNALERSQAQGQRNLSDGISVLRTAEGGLAEISNITIRLRELTVQAGNGTLDNQGRAAIQAEFDALTSEITRISEATEFGSHKLLNGDTSGAAAITIRDGTGSEGVVQISIGDSSAESLGLAGRDASDPATLDAIDEALSSVSATRGDIGATENRLRSGIRNLQETQVNTASARSRIADADFAKVASDRARSQILEQVAIATQVQANISAGSALGLLKP